MEFDEHVPIYVPEPEQSEYHASSYDDIQVKDNDKDPKEYPSKKHKPEDDNKDPAKDPNEENEHVDEDTKEPSEGSDETKPFEEDETPVTPPPPRHHGARISIRPQTHMAAFTLALIDAFATSEHMMMTSIKEVNLRVSYQAQVRRQESANFYIQILNARTDRRDIRLEIDVVRGQKTTYKTEL
nr:hypothetical protein [Tanacetum cinerariifolium]